MNVIDWFSASADFMAADRPDIYTRESAMNDLTVAVEAARESDTNVTISFASYFLTRVFDDDMEEFVLSKKLSGYTFIDNQINVYSYLGDVDLPPVDGEGWFDDDDTQ